MANLAARRWADFPPRVDAESKEAIEIGIKRHEPERLKEQIPIERLQMTQIKNYAVALGIGRS